MTVEHSSPKTLGVCHLRRTQQTAADCGDILAVSIQPSERAPLLAVAACPKAPRARVKTQLLLRWVFENQEVGEKQKLVDPL